MEDSKHASDAHQRVVTRVCAVAAQLLMQHGAESALVENVARRLGLALGVGSVEIAVLANAIIVTTLADGHCITTVRRITDRGINMGMVMQVQRLMLEAESGRGGAAEEVEARLMALKPRHYPRLLVVAMVGLSCAAFARLAGADWAGCGVAFGASAAGMAVRQQLSLWHFNAFLNFAASAFVAAMIAALALRPSLELSRAALAASVLFLVPGMPLINSLSDMLKGYVNTGIARLAFAVLLLLSASLGIALALACAGAPHQL
ncbi:MAG: threonine/serine exporter family protein [Terrimicrobiaceae bacterium]|nr:threonine/serine exporter family protein [Terrimicrobiaceae bacterium]